MRPEEMRDVLATIASYDGRAIDRRVIEDWHALAGGIEHGLALAAVRHWYAFNRGYMQPNDLATSAATILGTNEPRSVTAQRLDGMQLPHEITDSQLARPLWDERNNNG